MYSTLRGLLLVGALSLSGVSAHAEFSPQEKQEVINQIDAMNLLTAAAGELMTYLQTHSSAYEALQVQLSVDALTGASSARSTLLEGLVWLSGGNGSAVAIGSSSTGAPPASGGDRVGIALGVFDRAHEEYRLAEQSLISLRAACARDCAAVERATGYLAQSLSLFESFNRGLSFDSPWRDVSESDYESLLHALLWTDDQLERAWHESNGLASVPSLLTNSTVSGMNYQLMLWRVGWAFGLVVGAEHPSLSPAVTETLTEIRSDNRMLAQIAVAKNLLSDFTVPAAGQGSGTGLPTYYASICVDKVALLASSSFSSAAQSIGREIRHLCEAWWSSSGALWQASLHSYAGLSGDGSTGPPPPAPAPEPTPSPSPAPPPEDIPPPPAPPTPDPTPAPDAGVYDRLAAHLPSRGRWAQLPGTEIGNVLVNETSSFSFCDDIGCRNADVAFLTNGMAFDETTGRWWSAARGGGRGYGGNEIYRWDFASHRWSRDTEPVGLNGPRLRDANGNRLSCRMPTSGPPALSSPDGVLFVPSTNEILVLGVLPFCESGTAGGHHSWVWSVNNKTWRKLQLPNTQNPKTVFDRARGLVYAISHRGRFYAYDPKNNYEVVQDVNLRYASSGNAQFDDRTRYLYWTSYNDGLYRSRVGLDGSVSAPETVVNTAKAGISNPYYAFDIHGPSGKLVQWEGGSKVFRLDPESGRYDNVTPRSGPYPPSVKTSSNRVFSKWVYIDSLDAFIGVADPKDGIWVYRLP